MLRLHSRAMHRFFLPPCPCAETRVSMPQLLSMPPLVSHKDTKRTGKDGKNPSICTEVLAAKHPLGLWLIGNARFSGFFCLPAHALQCA